MKDLNVGVVLLVALLSACSDPQSSTTETTSQPAGAEPAQVKVEAVAPEPVPQKQQIGMVRQIEGTGVVSAKYRKEPERLLEVGDAIYIGDDVKTTDSVDVILAFTEGGVLHLRERTHVVMEAMDTAGSEIIIEQRLMRGAITFDSRRESGESIVAQIGSYIADVTAGNALFGVALCPRPQCDNAPGPVTEGIYISSLGGLILTRSRQGNLHVKAGETLYQKSKYEQPEIIATRPGIVFTDAELKQ